MSPEGLRDCSGPRQRQRVLLVVALATIGFWFSALVVRLYQIQVLQHGQHADVYKHARSRVDEIPAYRGDIVLADGTIVARSRQCLEVGIDPGLIPSERLGAVVRVLCDALDLAPERRQRLLLDAIEAADSHRRYVKLTGCIDEASGDRLLALAEEVLTAPLLGVETESIGEGVDRSSSALSKGARLRRAGLVYQRVLTREYPKGEFLCHVLGATSLDGAGIEGLEKRWNRELEERPGLRQVTVDGGQTMRFFDPSAAEVLPVHGFNLHLTIDPRIQSILEEELALGIERKRAEAGLGIVLDCRNGDVLAMASYPVFDPNRYHDYSKDQRELRRVNRAIESAYEPGSVFKPLIVAMALELAVCDEQQLIWEGGNRFRLRGYPLEDVKDHGPLTVADALVHSSNIGLGLIGSQMGPERVQETLERFRIGKSTGICLPGERQGRHTSAEDWNEVYSTIATSFGYEVMVSPLQLCAAFAAIANGGTLYAPRIVDRLERDGVEWENPRRILGRPLSETTSRRMRAILRRVVEEGTGQRLQMEGFTFGGKSGTADMDPNYTKVDYLASFEAFAPFEDPRFVVLVMVEKPREGLYYGGSVSGPIVAKVLQRYFRVQSAPVFEKENRYY